jgi:hypothetical protein
VISEIAPGRIRLLVIHDTPQIGRHAWSWFDHPLKLVEHFERLPAWTLPGCGAKNERLITPDVPEPCGRGLIAERENPQVSR